MHMTAKEGIVLISKVYCFDACDLFWGHIRRVWNLPTSF